VVTGKLTIAFLAVWIGGCARPDLRPSAGPIEPGSRIQAILINGGSKKKSNYHSHLVHVRRLTRLLIESGVPKNNITIFASDGPDEAPDLAIREPGRFREHWLIQDTDLDKLLGPPVHHVNSTVEGLRLLPAKKAALQTWFQLRAGQLGPGDTLLIFVTDHGQRGGKGKEATISLWDEKLPVSDLVSLLDSLDPEVQVILWMSQCYSAAFARAIYRDGEVLRGNVCGFFSTLQDRPAWGCYPEARDDREGLGHAMRFLDELRPGSRLSAAHDRVVITDRTPDVPHRSSDHFLKRLLEREAEKQKKGTDELTDKLLEEAWKQTARFAPRLETIDRLARRAGIEPPRSLRDLQAIRMQLAKQKRHGRTYKQRWGECLTDLRKLELSHFTTQHVRWKAKKFEQLLKKHGHKSGSEGENEDVRVELLEKLLEDFGTYLQRYPRVKQRMEVLSGRSREAADLSIRMQVREGAVLRMQMLLESIAGEVLAEKNPNLLAGLDRLRVCEGWALPGKPPGPSRYGGSQPADLPPLSRDLAKLEELRPSWLGVRYKPETKEFRKEHRLPTGAVMVRSVVPGSAAEKAGIRRGDTLFGTPKKPFEQPGSLRETVMLSPSDKPLELQLLRAGRRLTVAARLTPYPEHIPAEPGPPLAGQPAPSLLGLEALEGQLPEENSPVLLVFFSTWCGPCKRAMPALVSWAQKNKVPVVLVSSETREKMADWAAAWNQPRPARIALDPRGLVTDAFKASAYPTFVLLDGKGKIKDVKKGFSTEAGLPRP
jgi:thiol-disulfide isomerase/thioredoxin